MIKNSDNKSLIIFNANQFEIMNELTFHSNKFTCKSKLQSQCLPDTGTRCSSFIVSFLRQ